MDGERFDALARSVGHTGPESRRTVLAGLAGGLSVLVAALISPLARDEAAAGGALGGRLGGRHGKDSRGRDENRKNRRNKRNNKPRGGEAYRLKNVRMVVENLTATAIDYEGWIQTSGSPITCKTLDLQTVQPNEAKTFIPGQPCAYLWIEDKYYLNFCDVDPDLSFPFFFFAQEGTFSRQGCFKDDSGAVCHRDSGRSTQVNVGQTKVLRTADACGIRLEVVRENDISNERLFRVRLKP